jgi:alanine racemase
MPSFSGPKTWVEVSKSALTANAKTFKKRLGSGVALMAVVKSNAYGHGLVETARTLQSQADRFGVDNLDEAAALKKAGIKKPIHLLGFTPSWRMKEAVRSGFRITIASLEQAKAARAAANAAKRDAFLHVKVETGTTRQGLDLRQIPEIADLLRSSKRLKLEGLTTHYANIEDTTDHSYASQQLERFVQASDFFEAHGFRPPIRHTACTAAAALFPDTHFNMARVGIGLYGIWPSAETREESERRELGLELVPVLAWKTRIAQVKDVKRGTPISYGLTETMPRNGRLAVLGVGYWDGYDRGLSSVGEVIVKGRRAKVMGRVCMNMCMIDVTEMPSVKAEDEVILLGKSGGVAVSAEDLAAKTGTIAYEIVTRINPLLPRILV